MLIKIEAMNRKYIFTYILICCVVTIPLRAFSGVDEESIFRQARYPVSELDLQLSNLQRGWWQRYVSQPDEETKRKYPLITQAGLGIQLDYFGDDRISATGWVSNLNGFLKLSARDRKQLVFNTLDLVKSSLFMSATLVDKKTGRMSGKMLESRHIKLSVVINDITKNDKNENIRLFLPSDIGVGQAGFKDGQYVFSETYFLKLQVKNGLAVSGDPNKFIIENE
jgi:hypothetical protein